MTKIFISQPMNGKTNEEIENKRNYIIDRLATQFARENECIEIIDSFFKNAPHDTKPLWYLGESIKLMSEADIVFFCDGWQTARGCQIEHDCALEYGIDTMYEEDLIF